VVGLGTHGVDFASDFLGDKAELFALAFIGLHGGFEIVQVIGQTGFLLVDVEFFDVVNQLLLKPVLVVIGRAQGFQRFGDTGFQRFQSFTFVLLDGFELLLYVAEFFLKNAGQHGAFLHPEVNQFVHGFCHGCFDGVDVNLFVCGFFCGDDTGQAEQQAPGISRGFYAHGGCCCRDLIQVSLEGGGIDVLLGIDRAVVQAKAAVDFSPHQATLNVVA